MRPINLLPGPRERRRDELVTALPRWLAWALIIWGMLLIGVYSGFQAQKMKLEQTLSSLSPQVQALEPVALRVKQIEALQVQVEQLQQQLQRNTIQSIAPAMELLTSLMPEEIMALSQHFDRGGVSLSCSSIGLAPIGRFKQNLQQAAGISQVDVSAIEGSGSTDVGGATVPIYSFSVSLVHQGEVAHE